MSRGEYVPPRSRHSRNVDRLIPVDTETLRRLLPASISRNASARVAASYMTAMISERYDDFDCCAPGRIRTDTVWVLNPSPATCWATGAGRSPSNLSDQSDAFRCPLGS